MARPVVRFDGFATNYINENQMKLTVKLVPMERQPFTYVDVFAVLEKYGVKPGEILGLYKVSAADNSYSLFLANEEVLTRLKEAKFLEIGKIKLMVISMSEQIVTIRAHWLPLFYDNRILRAMLCDYGEVLEIRMCKSSYANLVALNGMREVVIKTDEIRRQLIPHLVNYGNGQSVLFTMQGRPPLCLKCHEIGHTRRDCESRRSFSNVVASEQSGQSDARPTDPVVVGPSVEAPSVSEDAEGGSSPRPSGTDGSGAVVGSSGAQQASQDFEMSDPSGSKRDRDEDEDFIPPNKPARVRPPRPKPVPTRNPWTPIMTVSDIITDE